VGIKDVTADNVKIYPVPASDKLMIATADQSSYTRVEILDMTGRTILSAPLTSKNQQLNVNTLATGVYILYLRDESGSKTYTSRIVKN
jgi:hypothetical protein